MELWSTGNPDTSNPVTISMLEYLMKRGREAMGKTKADATVLVAICTYPFRLPVTLFLI